MKSVALQDVAVNFGRVHALDGVSVTVNAGEIVMLVGPNGAGKSTFLHVLLGLVRAQQGTLAIDEKPLRMGMRGNLRSFRRQLGYLPEAVAFSDNLTGRNVLKFFARAHGVPKKRIAAVLERVGLEHAARRAVRGYSRGMRQRLGLAIAILAEPSLLVLDEPTGGLDQEGLDVLWGVFQEWKEQGRIVFLASHDLTLLERRVDRIGVLKSGHLLAIDTPAALRSKVGLPVRVTFGLENGIDEFREAFSDWNPTLSQDNNIVCEVPQERLLELVRLSADNGHTVSSLRVEEPGLDQVYDCLLVQEGE